VGLGIAVFELSGSLSVVVWILHGLDLMGELSIFSAPEESFDGEALGIYYVKQSILYLTLLGVVLSPFNLVVVVVDIHRELFLSRESDPYEELYAAE